MRLFTPALLGLGAIGVYASSADNVDNSNVTPASTPRYAREGVLPILEVTENYILGQTVGGVGFAVSEGGEIQCTALKPCIDGSCCNSNGHCGYRPEHCSPAAPTTCVGNCDAKAPCGEFSEDGKTTCPLNLCCSSLDFCGATETFCGSQMQMADDQPCNSGKCNQLPPTCPGRDTVKRRIAYYRSWNWRQQDCDKVYPSQLNVTGVTHLIYTFAVFDPKTFIVDTKHWSDDKTMYDFLAIRGVKKWFAIGGWEFSNEGPTRQAWSDMTSTKANRRIFIDSVHEFVKKWRFQGLELHWEWPGAWTRGGNPADFQNQVDLVRELREDLHKDFGLSIVIPAQWEYIKNMYIDEMQPYVDWLTALTYDLHGPWDIYIDSLGPYIKPHTDLKEISSAIDMFWLSSVSLDKINMAVANYGRGYTVADTQCKYYGCKFNYASRAGSCTKEDGLLSACEIQRIINEKNLKPQVIQGGAGAKEISWDDQWVSYDDLETINMKLGLAQDRCLGGLALWAVDYDTCDGGSGGGSPPGNSAAPGASASVSLPSGGLASPSADPKSSSPGNPAFPPGSSGVASSNPATSWQGNSAPPSSGAWSTQHSSQAGSGGIVPSQTASSAPGSSGAVSSADSSIWQSSQAGSSGLAPSHSASSAQGTFASSTSNAGSSAAWTSGSGSPVSGSPTAGSSAPDSTEAWTSNSGSSNQASGSNTWASASAGSSSNAWPSGTSPGDSSAQQDSTTIPLWQTSAGGSSSVQVISTVPWWQTPSDGSSGTQASSTVPWWQTSSGGSSGQQPTWTNGPSSGQLPSGSISSGVPVGSVSLGVPSAVPSSSSSTDIPFGLLPSLISGLPPSGTIGGSTAGGSTAGDSNTGAASASGAQPSKTPSSIATGPANTPGVSPTLPGPVPSPSSTGDPKCVPNDCKADCDNWNRFTFLFLGRSFCLCVPKKCDKDNNNNKKCKLLGCGCGWMGLPFGPGCPGLEFKIPSPCGIFGCDPCVFFGCPGTSRSGLIGYDGYCPEGGCEPCPSELCNRPGCTIPGGCGPKPGPMPTRPSNQPKECDDSQKTVITERFVSCTEGYKVSALPTSIMGTSSTLISSICIPLIDATVTVCGSVPGFDTTTTGTGTSTLTSAPACTRAPLSLDDDEGNNNPDDPLNTSSIFASNTTSPASSSIHKTSSTKSSTTTSSSTKSSSTTSSQKPKPTVDLKGPWKMKLFQQMERDYSNLRWELYNNLGEWDSYYQVYGLYAKQLHTKVEAKALPFGIDLTVYSPSEVEECKVLFKIDKAAKGCDYLKGAECKPYWQTEPKSESSLFVVHSCEQACKDNGVDPPLLDSDISCQDLDEAAWYKYNAGWKRDFECEFKGF